MSIEIEELQDAIDNIAITADNARNWMAVSNALERIQIVLERLENDSYEGRSREEDEK